MRIANLRLIRDNIYFDREKESSDEDKEIPNIIHLKDDKIELGVAPATNHSVIIRHYSACISRIHSEISRKKIHGTYEWFIEDKSTNGTYVNEKNLEGGQIQLKINDKIMFGDKNVTLLRYVFCVVTQNFSAVSSSNSKFSYKSKKRELAEQDESDCLDGFSSDDLFDKLLSAVNRKDINLEEFYCRICREIKLFFVYLLCMHDCCFNCYIYRVQKITNCFVCDLSIDEHVFPFKHVIKNMSIKERIYNFYEAVMVYDKLEERFDDQYANEHIKFRDNINARLSLKISRELPIYSVMWDSNEEKKFKSYFEGLSDESKIEVVSSLGLTSQILDRAEEKEVELIFNRLNLSSQQLLSNDEKKDAIRKFIKN